MYILLVIATVSTIPFIASSKLPLRVIGGKDALQNELTFVVRMELQIIKKSDATDVATNNHICTGAVLTPTRTLTAGHCIAALEDYLKMERNKMATKQEAEINGVIRYGSVHDTPWTENTVSRIIDSVIHPACSLVMHVNNDVGISRTEPITIKTYAKVSTMDFASLAGQEATIVGYGLTNTSDGKLLDTLELKKPLQILKVMVKRCPEDSGVYPDTCVARTCGQSSSMCPGDSGGPMLHRSGILAIYSAGPHYGCYVKSHADHIVTVDIFTALSPFIDWIQDQI